ncbi:serine O-acetyltransferase [Methylomagnum ishizawai]|uniref:serine O-acetyltransferase n=1 Tax=Methylomagnum ishizawai TaxID=1760988 RepID=A0A1Y6CT24_9GAMM|nr:serine O-acetyltransferase [Methylomagnum ishizawai]SMF93466.1 serine O-acetyltransferase [Methylomagnum ishizawai]
MWEKLKAEYGCIFERDPAAQSYFEIFTIYPGIHAVLVHRLSHRLWNHGLRWPARFLSTLARWWSGVEIHPGAQIGRRFFIDHGMGVVIGETATIGDDCTLYHGVTLGGTSWRKGKRHPTLGNGVVVGAGAKILGPITVGDGARIGSNSVVLKSVPAGATVVGIPGHMVSPDRKAQEERRQNIASKLGFDAYGMTPDMPDPVAHAVNHMLDHIQALDGQIEALKRMLQQQGLEVSEPPLPELEPCGLRQGGEKAE